MHRFFSIFRFSDFIQKIEPARLVVFGYLWYILAGWAFLSFPISQSYNDCSALNNLFVAVSAVSTTGLVPLSISGSYTLFGQTVILLLIQLGGIGYMTLGSFIVLSRRSELSQVNIAVGRTVFSLPESFELSAFIRGVIRFTVIIETIGTAALYLCFRQAGLENALFSAFFHSVSAFCTAGFSLYDDSFMRFSGDFWINITLSVLSFLGAVGFIVCIDVSRKLSGKIRQITLTSKIILHATLILIVSGTAILFLTEKAISGLSPDQRLLTAFFQCMSAMTTVGFNTVDIAALSKSSVLLIGVLMVIGSSPSGTGGGIKVTSISAMYGIMRSAIRGEQNAMFWGKQIPYHRLWSAVAGIGYYLMILVCGTFLLLLCETSPFEMVFFETASAMGTVGLSMGITSSLSVMGKLIIIAVMYCGRVGPLTIGAAFTFRKNETPVSDRDLAV